MEVEGSWPGGFDSTVVESSIDPTDATGVASAAEADVAGGIGVEEEEEEEEAGVAGTAVRVAVVVIRGSTFGDEYSGDPVESMIALEESEG